MGEHTPTDAVEVKVKDDEIIKLDKLNFRALYTPGHTSDSFCFVPAKAASKRLKKKNIKLLNGKRKYLTFCRN